MLRISIGLLLLLSVSQLIAVSIPRSHLPGPVPIYRPLASANRMAPPPASVSVPSAAAAESVPPPRPGEYDYRVDDGNGHFRGRTILIDRIPSRIRSETREEGSVIVRTLQWTSTRVVTLTEDVHTTFGSLRCSWSPPLVTMRFPLATASRWLGKSSCDGRLDMDASTTVEGITTVLEAGRSWTAVVLRSDRTSSGGGTESHGVITTWFSPELGQTVRWQSTMSGGTETGHLDRVLTR